MSTFGQEPSLYDKYFQSWLFGNMKEFFITSLFNITPNKINDK